MEPMKPRIANPANLIPDAMQALMALGAVAKKDNGVPTSTLNLVYLRTSQINGCSVCVDMHARAAKQAGETDERLIAVGAWRDAPYFTPAERAALALAESATRLPDRSDPVPDDVWFEAAQHYDEKALASLTVNIAVINLWNRLNVPTRQIAGEWIKSAAAQKWQQENAAATR
ncbi:carboxymuconolactone decarboxylase family protein [Edaphobacter modestus]|uniref:AhpD family alkylhydroperoxidase n=1 Tax=Edaphobacter modestus TaxID=388466 RepID=A0A4Q7YWN5_9BACT|nr:carboxymuconolactone decarboxylase family protein [Edaphobacter modestus]RZU41523.1 AhpD family alkylhydroperoxidase [Edaphobacter modestus]